jgi:hypothetical protein
MDTILTAYLAALKSGLAGRSLPRDATAPICTKTESPRFEACLSPTQVQFLKYSSRGLSLGLAQAALVDSLDGRLSRMLLGGID